MPTQRVLKSPVMQTTLHAVWKIALMAGIVTALTACTRAARTTGTPQDFSFGILVPSAARDAGMQPGWIAVDADGGVREFAGEVTRATRLPRRATTLSRAQMDALHERLASAKVLQYGAVGEPVGDASAVLSRPGSVGVWWSADGRRRSFVLSPQLSEDAEALQVIAQTYRDVREQTWETAP